MITPVEVLGKELKRGFGYKAIEVDEFLEDLARDYEKIYKENNELKEKVSALTENLNHYRTIEESLKKALVLAEETSRETIENANRTAKALENEALKKSDDMIRQAEQEAAQIRISAREDFAAEKSENLEQIENYKKLIHKLESDYCSYKSRMLQFINGQRDILNNPVYEMEFQIAGENPKSEIEKEQKADYAKFASEQ